MKKALTAASLIFAASQAVAAMPYSFAPGGVIRASELNANFTYLENLLAAKTWVRATTAITYNTEATIYTVPANGTQHLITNVFSPGCSIGFALIIGSSTLLLGSAQGNISNINAPVNPGETVKVLCQSSVTATTSATIVLSK